MATHVALLRGINVGRAKRIAMADLRAVVAGLGCANVRTLLNSGNVVFDSDMPPGAAVLREAIAGRTGVTAEVVFVSAADLAAIVAENPLVSAMADPSRGLVAFPIDPAHLARPAALLDREWAPDQLAIGPRAAYLWCAGGISRSTLMEEFGRLAGATVTMRNWATVLKLHALTR